MYLKIEFSAVEAYYDQKQNWPKPIKLNIPEWYKKIQNSYKEMTIKGCMPFLDTLTTGYVLELPQDLHLTHNLLTENKERITVMVPANKDNYISDLININSRGKEETHPIEQLKDSSYVEKNKNLPFQKILNPWFIKTPPGYSCLFVPPLNNTDDRFSIIPGIVDTDIFPRQVNFPFVVNGDKYPTLDTLLKRGTPYVQIIPFKRENWEMDITIKKEKEVKKSLIWYSLDIFNKYKNENWYKKKWK